MRPPMKTLVDMEGGSAESRVLTMTQPRHRVALALCACMLVAGPVMADDTDVPSGVGLTSKDQDEGKKEKKPRVPAWKVPGATVGKVLGALMMSAGSGWVSGKAYPDNPLTEQGGDGPGVGRGLHDSGTAARWHLAYVFPKGWFLGGYARLQLTRGSNDGSEFSDKKYDAWLVGLRAGRIFYSKNNLDIFWYGGLGYGHIRHRCSNVTDPNAQPDLFTRRDLWPFTPRDKVDVYKKSGFVDVNLGVLIIYRFTPVFGLVFEVNGDFIAPDVVFNIDVSGGLSLSFG